MSPNPEQFSFPEQPKNSPAVRYPHAGGEEVPADVREVPVEKNIPPLTEEVIAATPSPETPFDGLGGEQVILSPAEKAKFDQWRASVAASHETPALSAGNDIPRATPKTTEVAPEKKSKLKRNLIIGGTALTVFGVGSLVTVNALLTGITNAADKNSPPAPGTTNSGELVPGQSGTTEQPAPVDREGRGTATHKFLAEDGKTFLTHEQLVSSIKVPVDKYPDSISAQVAFYELMEKRSNYEPTEEEVRNNLNIPADQQLTNDDYRAAAALYRNTYNGLFENEAGGLFKFMDQLGSDVFDMQIANYGESESGVPKAKYEVDIQFAKTKPEFVITDNITETSLMPEDSRLGAKDVTGFLTGTYELTFTGFGPDEVTEGKEKVWKFGDRVVVTKKAE